jgi:hypothetical protein
MELVESLSAATGPLTTIFEHSGVLSESVIAATSGSLRTRLQVQHVENNRARKIFSSYVELAYNILHYGQPDVPAGITRVCRGDITVVHDAGDYRITARNRLSNLQADRLAIRLDRLRDMSMDEIRFEYRLRLTNLQFEQEDTASKGAGLGLITIARNATRPVEYRVHRHELEPDTCLFQIQTII